MNQKKLGFGFLRLPVINGDNKNVDHAKVCEMVDAFIDRGYSYFDTSFVYHGGKSEEAFRKTVAERYPRDKFTVATKLPTYRINSEEDVLAIFNQQLENCGVEYFDYYLMHNVKDYVYDQKIKPFHIFEQLSELKTAGKIRKLGFSFHDSPEELDRMLSEHPETDFVQIVINYHDWNSSWIQSRRCYEVIRKHGKQVTIMEPVKAGMLAHPPQALLEQMQTRNTSLSPAAWALRFVCELDGVIAVLSGMSTMEQVLDNTTLMNDPAPLTDDEREMLLNSVPLYRAMGPYKLSSFEQYRGIAKNGMPVDEVLENYNNCRILNNLGAFAIADTNYYYSLRLRNGITDSWIEAPIMDRDGNDITEMVREAENYFLF